MSITNFNDFDLNESYAAFNPQAMAERLKRREQQNIVRYRAAQDRVDNYAITYYKYRIQLDKIDLEKLKVLTAIHKLKQTK
jgi:hypothetical protein|tara:strand:+ start:1088 stop:1330 length:243 start_codon:yes stop_codon:yes gene_type:complete